jgi:hypothetical protein
MIAPYRFLQFGGIRLQDTKLFFRLGTIGSHAGSTDELQQKILKLLYYSLLLFHLKGSVSFQPEFFNRCPMAFLHFRGYS